MVLMSVATKLLKLLIGHGLCLKDTKCCGWRANGALLHQVALKVVIEKR